MKRIFTFTVLLTFTLGGMAIATEYTIKNIGVWPSTSSEPRAMSLGNASEHLYWGYANKLWILNSDTLESIGSISLDTYSGIMGIYKDPNRPNVYVAAGSAGFHIVDVSVPSAPVLLSTVYKVPDNPGYYEDKPVERINAYDLSVLNGQLYLADRNFGLRVFDVSSPASPSEAGSYIQWSIYGSQTTGGYIHVTASKLKGIDRALILDTYYGLHVFDVSNINDIPKPDSKDMRSVYLGNIALVRDLCLSLIDDKQYAFITSGEATYTSAAVVKMDLFGNDETPETIDIKNIGRCDTLYRGYGVAPYDKYAVVADSTSLQTVNMKDPIKVNSYGIEEYGITGTLDTDISDAYAVLVNGSTTFLADLEVGVRKVDISDPSEPTETLRNQADIFSVNNSIISETLQTNDSGADILISSNSFSTVSGGSPGLIVINNTNESLIPGDSNSEYPTPYLKGSVLLSGEPSKLCLYPNRISSYPEKEQAPSHAIIACGSAGVGFTRISSPSNPGTPYYIEYRPEGDNKSASAVDVLTMNDLNSQTHDDILISAWGENGLTQMSLSDITSPGEPVVIPYDKAALSLDMEEDRLYIAAGADGIAFVDMTDPENPGAPVFVSMPGPTRNLAIKNGYAYITGGEFGLWVLDLSNPYDPDSRVTVNLGGTAQDVFVDNDIAYVSHTEGGFTAVYIKDPKNPVRVREYESKGSTDGIFAHNGLTYLSDGLAGINIVELKGKDEEPIPEFTPEGDSSACFIKSSDAKKKSLWERVSDMTTKMLLFISPSTFPGATTDSAEG